MRWTWIKQEDSHEDVELQDSGEGFVYSLYAMLELLNYRFIPSWGSCLTPTGRQVWPNSLRVLSQAGSLHPSETGTREQKQPESTRVFFWRGHTM